MSEVNDRFVKHGLWVNWNQGPIMGQTITTDARTGTVIVAILTVLITTAASQLWNLMTFLYHQRRAARAAIVPTSGLFWQQQVLLRTLPSPISMAADMFKLWVTWKNKSDRFLVHSLCISCFALFFGAATIISGIFSSLVISTSNLEILVDSPSCGQLNTSRLYEELGTSTGFRGARRLVLDSYTRTCYQNGEFVPGPAPALCRNTYINPSINFDTVSADCPWEKQMCLSPAIAMDSGVLDANDALGLNLKSRDRVKFRRRTTCSVLPTEGHIVTRDASEFEDALDRPTLPGEQATVVRYGTIDGTLNSSDTFFISQYMTNLTVGYFLGAVMSFSAPPKENIGIFTPLPEMSRTDADVAVIVVFFEGARYDMPVDDPMFAAHKPLRNKGHPNWGSKKQSVSNFTTYGPDHPAGLLGCAVQYQFCFERPGRPHFCTALGGLPSEIPSHDFEDASPIQLAALEHIRKLFFMNTISQSVGEFFTLSHPFSIISGIHKDQWIIEANGWESYAYAGVQAMLADTIMGMKTYYSDAELYTYSPTTPGEKQLCQSLRMRKSSSFANINVFALAFVLTFTITVSFFNITLLKLFIFLSRFRMQLSPRIEHWIRDGVFQLQRIAFDAHGQGTWSDTNLEIPSTNAGQLLTALPISIGTGGSSTLTKALI